MIDDATGAGSPSVALRGLPREGASRVSRPRTSVKNLRGGGFEGLPSGGRERGFILGGLKNLKKLQSLSPLTSLGKKPSRFGRFQRANCLRLHALREGLDRRGKPREHDGKTTHRRNLFSGNTLNANGKIREAISPRRAVQKMSCIGKLLFFFPHPPVGGYGKQNPGTASRSTVLGKLPRKPIPRLPFPLLGSKTRGEHWGGIGLRGTTLRGLRGLPANLGGGSA